jgi:hypothetical protein
MYKIINKFFFKAIEFNIPYKYIFLIVELCCVAKSDLVDVISKSDF